MTSEASNIEGSLEVNGKSVSYVIGIDVDKGLLDIKFKFLKPDDMDPVMCALSMVMLGHSIANEMGVDIIKEAEETEMIVKREVKGELH